MGSILAGYIFNNISREGHSFLYNSDKASPSKCVLDIESSWACLGI